MITRQMVGIYNKLSEDKYLTAEALAEELNVSSKTIRNQLKNLNEVISGYGVSVESKHGAGYRLVVDSEEKRSQLEQLMHNQEFKRSSIPNSSEERVNYLLEFLLNTDDYVKLDALSELLYISKKTLTLNLKEVENKLNEYHLQLVRKPNYGILVEGREFDRRLCIAEIAAKKVQVMEKLIGSQDVTEEIQWIRDCIQTCLAKYDFTISNVAYQNLILHIQIAIMRMRAGHYVPGIEEGTDQMHDQMSYTIAEEILSNVHEKFQVEFPPSEISYIAIHLEGKKTLAHAYPEEGAGENLVINQEISDLVDLMLLAVYDSYKFDFRNDLDLRMSLSRHLVPLTVRLRHDLKLTNPLLKEIQERYSLAFTMAQTACVILNFKFHTTVRDDEIGYIALLFALALERKQSEIQKKNILLVCASGQGSAQLLLYRYQKEFGPFINTIKACDVGRVGEQDFSEIDYVFTTVPIPVKVPVPIQEVQYFLKGSDIWAVRKTLMGKNDSSVFEMYREELFLPHQNFADKEEALQVMCSYVIDRKLAPPEFYDSVKAREAVAKTAFGNMVAMPHPIEVMGDHPFVCVATLDKPIPWIDHSDTMVQAIFLISVANYENFDIQRFYQVTARLFLDEASMKELIKNQTFETLANLLLKMEQQVEEDEI